LKEENNFIKLKIIIFRIKRIKFHRREELDKGVGIPEYPEFV
jgi:hypothetical protein